MKVGVLFGGRSGEHEVSLQSARSIIDVLAQEPDVDLLLVGIEKSGRWVLLPDHHYLEHADDPKRICLAAGGIPVTLAPDPTQSGLLRLDDGARLPVDVIFPVLHGTYGEDGTVQGLLELCELPYVGAPVTAAALAMDKILSKRVFRDGGLPVLPALALSRSDRSAEDLVSQHQPHFDEWGYPLFVKPVNLGSSVGISRVDELSELAPAIREAFRYDTEILIEKGIDGAREIECAVLGNSDPQASILGEIVPRHRFYSYEAKYVDPDGAELKIPADLDDAESARIRQLAIQAFQVSHCAGLARVDFLVDPRTGEWFLNEINTMPGFTKISMYPKLWVASGMSYAGLVRRLLELAIARRGQRESLERSFPLVS